MRALFNDKIVTAFLAKELRMFILDYPIARVKFNSQNLCLEVIAIYPATHPFKV